jgi:dihydropteroate synthase
MGIVNVTPDSFSDGGRFAAADAAIDHGVSLAEAGAEIIDIGGESTRPGAMPVAPDDEARRVLPVISALANRGLLVSADTRNAATMATAIAAGARIVNDVAALRGEGALEAVRQSAASVVLMHMLGDPRTMQAQPRYAWAPGDIFDFLAARVAACQAAGIERSRIAVDPGIGFGQNDLHIAQVMDHLAMLHGLGCAVAVGASRKGFIGRWSRGEGPDQRLAGSLAAVLAAVAEGVQIIRVHDVAETRQALAVASRLGS